MIAARVAAVFAVVFVGSSVGAVGAAQAAPGACAAGDPLRPTAELFATDNTETITDPADHRLRNRLEGFELAVDAIAVRNVALPVGSTLVSGVFWSQERHHATYERSREFHLACVDGADLGRIAQQVRARFGQESVLTFEHRAAGAPGIDAFIVEVADIDLRRFHDALVADPVARERLVGGSVTEQNTLILVADIADLEPTRRFVERVGGTWDFVTVRYGDREFVGA
ncbi:hypothetical protein OHB12_33530 [Nocardia sp. NBC_01730]|uniref:hypothetical protein n=1 Tax=Nocardia sp. NBC_01730 TaxID=2975998 RepID=UPI002E102B79|nr:hypothetical protein OHB12_33530 [Nocardia sp. NBC_01730]